MTDKLSARMRAIVRASARVLLVPSLVVMLATLDACGDSSTEPPTGSLVIAPVTGLPDGTALDVTVDGPHGFHRVIDARTLPDTFDALPRGAYVVTAPDVTVGDDRWSPSPVTQSLNVADGYRVSAHEIAYAVASARLVVEVAGLPAGAAAAVTVTGPGNFRHDVTATTTLGPLEVGTYTVSATDVQANGGPYHPGPAAQSVTLAAGSTQTVIVDHGTGSGSLVVDILGVPAGTDASVTVTGPGGYARTLGASRTLEHLAAGSYTIAAATVAGSLATYAPLTATQRVDVTAAASASASVAYTGTAIDLGVERVVDGLVNPSYMLAPDGDARLFVVERAGRIRLVKNGALVATPFLDISARVNSAGERGMLGLAFDPQFATNGTFYVYYVDASGSVAVERILSTPGSDVAGASGGMVIVIPHGGSEHHGGTIAFGPDGMLYVGPGDGGCCGDPHDYAQNLNVLLGKVLRLDVRNVATYAIPAGNPLVGRTGARSEIWAWGLRNPWRFSFDAPSGRLYIGDVGQDAHEEVDAVATTAAGRNYGWPIREATACYRPSSGCATAGLTMPVAEYSHGEGCSVTGGWVYRGARIPELTGHYLYADYCRGWLRSFRLTSAGAASESRQWPNVTVPQALSFGRDGAGELYLVSGAGTLWRIVKR